MQFPQKGQEIDMGYADCGTDSEGRPIGYAHPAKCDLPECDKDIHRGISYACGGMHGVTEYGCEKYFCCEHLEIALIHDEQFQLCPTCSREQADIIKAQDIIDEVQTKYDCEQTRDLALKSVFRSFREESEQVIENIIDHLPLEGMTTELIVSYGMAANAHLGKDHPVRNSFCHVVLQYFEDAGVEREQVISIFGD